MKSDAPRQDTIFRPNDVLNNTYRIEAILGKGGTSEVYRARSEISGRVVAVKALRWEFSRNEDYLALMTREEDVREIRHDAIVRYFDTQRTDDGTVYLVMDHVDGPGLDRKLRDGGMSAPDLMVVAQRVAEGLAVAHGRNIVHRDLSPDNIILRGGHPSEAVIIDFGIAKDTNPGAETIVGNEFAGKYAYAAPEQLSGDTDARSDIYALGALLLSTFRGKAPDVGRNPIEVIQRKSQPLDTQGVPEPLKSLIDRMTQPDRANRFQSAFDVLEAIRSGPQAPADTTAADETVIVPRPRVVAETTAPPTAPQTAPPAASNSLPDKKQAHVTTVSAPRPASSKKGGLIAVAGLVLVAVLAAAAWFGGVLGPGRLPVQDPYTLIAQRGTDGVVQVVGFVPGDQIAQDMAALVEPLGGTASLTLASGAITETWGQDVLALIRDVADLPEWRVAVSGNDIRVTGLAPNRAEHQRVLSALASLPPGLQGSVEVELGPRFLPEAPVRQALDTLADCGALSLSSAPATGWPNTARIDVGGRVASVATKAALNDSLAAMVGTRDVRIDVEVLNPALCEIEAALPRAPAGGFGVVFGFGDRPDLNPAGRYFVGENPVIDVVIPADVTSGVLYVMALDVSGNVFHMLPNLNRADNDVVTLRAGRSGPVAVRVAYGLAEAQGTGKLAFNVDDSALGKTKVVVLHAPAPIFDGLRPMTESAQSFVQALQAVAGPVESLDSKILTTAKP
ncbi:MAG: serine/threonine-protein kinase [Gemmobacter sp.]|nr:serine/threonine-protein kinase [Gemmobacter sp.]